MKAETLYLLLPQALVNRNELARKYNSNITFFYVADQKQAILV